MSNLLTLQQAADKMNVKLRTLRSWLEQGKITAIKMPNGGWRIREDWLDNWLDKRTVKAKAF